MPYPHPGQIETRKRSEGKSLVIICAGRGWYKTTDAVAIAVEDALAGHRYVWAAPIADQAHTAWLELQAAALDALGERAFNVTHATATFPGGGEIVFRSMDSPHRARSKHPDRLVVDEAGDISEEAYQEVLMPMLVTAKDPIVHLRGTPRGMNWFWEEAQRAEEEMEAKGDATESVYWQIPTLGCAIEGGQLIRKPHPLENPNASWKWILKQFGKMPERKFRQEYLAEWIEDAGGVFSGVRACIDSGRRENEGREYGHAYQGGADFARIHDFTVIDVLDETAMRQVHFERLGKIPYHLIYDKVAAVAKKFGCSFVIDSTGDAGNQQAWELRHRGVSVIPFSFTNRTKTDLVDHLVILIEKSEVRLMDQPQQTRELTAYQYATNKTTGTVRMAAPRGESHFDDCVTSLALACYNKRKIKPLEADFWKKPIAVSQFANISPGMW